MNVLFISEISPFPINGGERIRSYGLLKILNDIDHNVIAIVGNQDKIDFESYQSQLNLYNIKFLEFPLVEQNRYESYIHEFKKNKIIHKLFNEILSRESIDVVFLDYAFLGQYINTFKTLGIPVIYGTHNSQALLTKEIPTTSFRQQLKRNGKVYLQQLHEKLFFKKSNKLIVVSNEDKDYHKKFVAEKNIVVLPNFLDEEKYTFFCKKKENYLVMTANFNAFQNYKGLEWFLNHVWNDELRNLTTLKLVGKGSTGILQKLNIENRNNIVEVGMVENIQLYISKAKVSLIPLLHGSGTRLKCLESMALKTLIVGTNKGIEGILHENNIVVADRANEFQKALLDILKNKVDIVHKTGNAYRLFLEHYSLRSAKQTMIEIFEDIK